MNPISINSPGIRPNGIPDGRTKEVADRPSSLSDADRKLQSACEEFEEIFLRMILKEARVTRSMLGEEGASQLYGDMTRETLAKALAQGGGIGLAETLYRQLSQTEEPFEKSGNHQIADSTLLKRR